MKDNTKKTMRTILIWIGLIAAIATTYIVLSRWEKTLNPTTMEIKDSIRHYYPIVLGDELAITCEITNTGDEPLSITDIQPSNFSISLESDMPGLLPPGAKHELSFIFHSEKNVGYTEHTIRFFGNIKPNGYSELTFDTHIVRPSIDEIDYEEVYFRMKRDMMGQFIDGELGQRGYWVDGADDSDYNVEDSAYQRSYKKYLIY